MLDRNLLDPRTPVDEPPRCPKCHAPMTLTDVTYGAMNQYTRTFECSTCDRKATLRTPDVTALEAELTEARARVAGLEAELPVELQGGSANAHANTLRKWNAEIEAAGGESTIPAISKQGAERAVLVWNGTLEASVPDGVYIVSRCEDEGNYQVLYRMTGDATSRIASKNRVATIQKATILSEDIFAANGVT